MTLRLKTATVLVSMALACLALIQLGTAPSHRTTAYDRYCLSAHLPPNGQPTPTVCVPKPV